MCSHRIIDERFCAGQWSNQSLESKMDEDEDEDKDQSRVESSHSPFKNMTSTKRYSKDWVTFKGLYEKYVSSNLSSIMTDITLTLRLMVNTQTL